MPSCPECDAEIEVDALDEFDVDVGDRLTCGPCSARLEVVDVEPVELAAESDLADLEDGDCRNDDEHSDASSAEDDEPDKPDDWAG